MQYLYSEKYFVEASETGSGIESDNNEKNHSAKPITNPTLANFEFLGSNGSKYGIVIRGGSGYTLINGIVSGFDKAQLAIDDSATLANDKIFFQSVALAGSKENRDLYAADKGVTEADIERIFSKGKYCATNAYTTEASVINPSDYNSFFDKAPFVGAFEKNDDWRFGWSVGVYK
jgi:hypothetical protein